VFRCPVASGSFGGSDGESKGVEGISRVNRISNLLTMLVTIAGFDSATSPALSAGRVSEIWRRLA
jgi:hypothetical protein